MEIKGGNNMQGDNNYLICPSYCEIKNLKIVSQEVVNKGENTYLFKNNLVESEKVYLIDYDIIFYMGYEGNVNEEGLNLNVIVPTRYLNPTARTTFNINDNTPNRFLVYTFSSYNVTSQQFNVNNFRPQLLLNGTRGGGVSSPIISINFLLNLL